MVPQNPLVQFPCTLRESVFHLASGDSDRVEYWSAFFTTGMCSRSCGLALYANLKIQASGWQQICTYIPCGRFGRTPQSPRLQCLERPTVQYVRPGSPRQVQTLLRACSREKNRVGICGRKTVRFVSNHYKRRFLRRRSPVPAVSMSGRDNTTPL